MRKKKKKKSTSPQVKTFFLQSFLGFWAFWLYEEKEHIHKTWFSLFNLGWLLHIYPYEVLVFVKKNFIIVTIIKKKLMDICLENIFKNFSSEKNEFISCFYDFLYF